MNWIQKSPELLFIHLVLVAISAVAIYNGATYNPSDSQINLGVVEDKLHKIEVDFSPFSQLAQYVTQTVSWIRPENNRHRLFISRKMEWQPKEGTLRVYDATKAGADGISPAWKEQYGFSTSDPTVAAADPDKDGFSNKEEYEAKTDPTSDKEHPDRKLKLRLVSFDTKPYIVRFNSTNEMSGELFFQINLENPLPGEKKSQTLKKGASFGSWNIVDYRKKEGEKIVGGTPMKTDISELDIQNKETQKVVTLVFREKKDIPIVTGKLLYSVTNTEMPIELGKPVTLDFDNNTQWIVTELSSSGATLTKSDKSNTQITVPKQ